MVNVLIDNLITLEKQLNHDQVNYYYLQNKLVNSNTNERFEYLANCFYSTLAAIDCLIRILAKTINLYKPNNLKNIMINFIQNILKENNNRLFNELKLTLDKKLLLISTHVLLSLNKLNKEEKNIDEMIFLQVRRFLKDLFFSIIFNSYYLIKYSQKIFLKLWRISFSSVLILN